MIITKPKPSPRLIAALLIIVLALAMLPPMMHHAQASNPPPNPTWSTTRAEALVMIIQAKEPALFTNGSTPTAALPFSDVKITLIPN